MKRRQFFAAATAGVAGVSLLPSTVSAAHHRVHSKGFLSNAIGSAGRMSEAFEAFLADIGVDDIVRDESGNVIANPNYIRRAAIFVPQICNKAICLLDHPGVRADTFFQIRRLINQPRFPTDGEESALRRIRTAMDTLFAVCFVSRVTPQNITLYRDTGIHIAGTWRWLDRAAWHITDAINEEVYGDPKFAEVPE